MHILVIYTGGATGPNIEAQLKDYLELQLVATVDITLLADIAGADVPYSLSTDIAKTIFNGYHKYDGFVVVHSVDNVLYTANLLAFQLYPLGKPVIFTGTTLAEDFFTLPNNNNFSGDEQVMYRKMSLRTSLVTAVQLATQNVSGVLLAYGPRIVHAVRALESTNTDHIGFTSWQAEDVATVRFGIELTTNTGQPRQSVSPELQAGVDPRVIVLRREPQPDTLIIPPETKAVLMHAYQDQLLPRKLVLPPGIPCFVLGTQGRLDLPPGMMIIPPSAPTTALCKLMVGSCHYSGQDLIDFMLMSVTGEGGKV
ncbi:MAG: asparaginase [Candidatus Kerfeldbacteria bacterium]|nr:asparaginase [Candidatus Kerfeldbacteria bacterium]